MVSALINPSSSVIPVAIFFHICVFEIFIQVNMVNLQFFKFWMGQPFGQFTVIGKQQNPCSIPVKAANGVDPFFTGPFTSSRTVFLA